MHLRLDTRSLDHAIMDRTRFNEASYPLQENRCRVTYLSCRIVESQRSSSEAQGIRGRTSETRVTRDESQVRFGGMLALDHVLGDSWSC
jgi:hypothetical protein